MEIEIENRNNYRVKSKRLPLKKLNTILQLKLDTLIIHLLSDDELLLINQKFLAHNYYTDIITFDLRDEWTKVAELFISIDRVKDNSILLNINPDEEYNRILVHGLLHLAGYKDKKEKDKIEIKKQEDYYLNLLFHVKK